MKRLLTLAGLALAFSASAQAPFHIKSEAGECLTLNGAASRGAPCNAADKRQLFRQVAPVVAPAPVPSAPTPAPSAPAPAPSTPTDPKTHPAEVGADVPLTLATSSVTAGYQSSKHGPYLLSNNTWGVKNIPGGPWSQQVGMVGAGDGVDFRIKWDFSRITCPKCDVISYPEVIYGTSASFPRTASAATPKPLNQITSLVTEYKSAKPGTMVKASHLAYDLWTSKTPDNLAGGNRLAEIMLPEFAWNGYGVPNSPAAATAGRSGPATGRNPHGYQGRHTIGGAAFDVYYFPPNSPYTGLAWKFIVFAPVVYGGADGKAREWKPLLDFGVQRGWLGASDSLNSVELGVEPAYQGSAGEVTVRGYSVKVQ